MLFLRAAFRLAATCAQLAAQLRAVEAQKKYAAFMEARLSDSSEWKKPDRSAEANKFLDALCRLREVTTAASMRMNSSEKITVTLPQEVFMDVVFLLLSELDFGRASDMGLPHAYKQWQFSFYGITVRANRNASGWTYPDRIRTPDGNVFKP